MGHVESIKAIRASILDVQCVVDKPEDIEKNIRFIEDGLMLVVDGKIEWVGQWQDGKQKVPPSVRVRSYPGKIVMLDLLIRTCTTHNQKWSGLMVSSY
ncbi:hypothetical protein [Shewanella marina]|uniref:hypothetical protein n=1 Tax=Shewanella marina TaxID=487319 RepID=UPI000A7D25C2|nr:hypothetical protein [Shewanella marina]